MKDKIKITEKFLEGHGLDTDILDNLKDTTIKRLTVDNAEVLEEAEGYVSGVISDISIDSDGDVILPKAFDFKRFEKNPVVLFNHSLSEPIGFVDDLQVSSQSVVAKVKFGKTPEAQKIHQLAKDGVLRTFSVGFITLEEVRRGSKDFDWYITDLKTKYPERFNDMNALSIDRIVTQALLVELSIVTIPANMNAVMSEIKALKQDKTEEVIEVKAEEVTDTKKVTDVVNIPIDKVATQVEEKALEVVVEEEVVEEKKIVIKKVGNIDPKIRKVSSLEIKKQQELNDTYLSLWGI
jgi:HK97 family phage prohead protease